MRLLSITSVSLISLAMHPLSASAADCGNVTAKGVCQDAKTLVFCEDGELEVIRCVQGELCAYDERFSGAAGCIATRYAGCGAVPEQGLCAGTTLLYCANGRVEERECPTGTTCEAMNNAGVIDFDCVATGVSAGTEQGEPETPVEPGEDKDGVDNPTPVQANDAAPLPSVQKGGAGPAADFEAGGDGCQGGAHSLIGLGGLWLLATRRRRLA